MRTITLRSQWSNVPTSILRKKKKPGLCKRSFFSNTSVLLAPGRMTHGVIIVRGNTSAGASQDLEWFSARKFLCATIVVLPDDFYIAQVTFCLCST